MNLGIWFALHTVFRRTTAVSWGWLHADIPEITTFDPFAGVLVLFALMAMFVLRRGMAWTLAATASIGAAWTLAVR
ncbi:hypothetical protein [Tahibacter soli]|uniref:Chromate transporter n=1 Tax=Tahibacter soli TaxID=2983605 RepID=A0A9X4BNA2_9GAMM|nr:hypothetical protein [Tahibacter soli]MDC8016184.1 hypothetical protein [Tahibacter soli]